MRIVLLWLLLPLLILFALVGCSSVPDFKPSKPLEEASSLEEGFELCGAYRIKGERNASGRAMPARAVVLVPWLNCFSNMFREFPEAKEHQDFVIFFRALRAKYDGIQPSDAEVVDWPAMNLIMERVVVHLQKPQTQYSEEERKIIARNLPGFALHIAERSGVSNTAPRTIYDKEIQAWVKEQRDLTLKSEQQKSAVVKFSDDEKNYCKNYLAYRGLVFNLEELVHYRSILAEQMLKPSETSKSDQEQKAKVESRLDAMKEEARSKRKNLDRDLAALRAEQGPAFKNELCVVAETRSNREGS